MINKVLLPLYIFLSFLFMLALYFDNNIIKLVIKPLPILLLIFLIEHKNPYNKLIFWGLIFSVFGDIFLADYVSLFIPGLLSFLVAHIFYIIAFVKRDKTIKIIWSIPFYIYGIFFLIFLYPYLNDFLIPVTVYLFVIVTMVWRSFVQRKSTTVAQLAFIGAIIFCLSDSIIAINKFHTPFSSSAYFIMVTYWFAQFLIFKSTE